MAALTNPLLSQPLTYSELSDYGKQRCERFFALTDSPDHYANGTSLTELADLFTSVRNAIHVARLNISPDQRTQDQWQLNRLSGAKERLAKAIVLKKSYYENNIFGIITKYVLMLFCMWNKGHTSDIIEAEDTLLFWDSRRPVGKISVPENPNHGKYFLRQDFDNSQLDTSRFYNYNPSRLIELASGEKIDYRTL
jgi:hypothetical protein